MSDSFNKLIELFRRFPGIGPRQAKRFAYFLLGKDAAFLKELTRHLAELKKDVLLCQRCFRFYEKRGTVDKCALCRDTHRNDKELMVVATDTDLESIEKSGSFSGRYFVLGGTVSLLETKPQKPLRFAEMKQRVGIEKKKGEIREIILALSANPEGEHTTDALRAFLTPLLAGTTIKISALGRGLSTGSELEYADAETLKSALKNRSAGS